MLGTEHLGGRDGAGHRRNEALVDRQRSQPLQLAQQRRSHGIDQGAVEWIVEIEAPGADPHVGRRLQHPIDVGDASRHGDASPAVDRSDLDAGRARGLEEAAGLAVAQHQCRHAAAAAHDFLMTAAGDDDIDGLVEAQGTGAPGRGDLADAVPQSGCGDDAALFEGANGGDLQGEQQGLRIGCPAQPGSQVVGEQDIDDRPVLNLGEAPVDIPESVLENRIRFPGVPSHAGPLRAVSGEQEGERLVAAQGLAGQHRVRGLALGERGEVVTDFVGRPAASDEAVRERIAKVGAGRDEGGGVARGGGPLLDIVGGEGRQGLAAVGRQQQGRRRGGVVDLYEMGDRPVAAQDDVRVCAAESEGIDADQFGPALIGQATVLANDLQVELVEWDIGIRCSLVQRCRNHAAVERDDGLQQAGQTRNRFEMSDIGFDRTDGERLRALLAEALAQGIGLDRIADPCAGAVCFDEAEIGGIDAEVAVDLVEQPSLRVGRRQGHAGGAAILVHA